MADASSYLAFKHAILPKTALDQPLTTSLILKSNSWIEKGGRTRRATTVQEKVCQYSDSNHNNLLTGINILACVYEIYKQSVQEMDMYSHLLEWKTFLETVLERKLAPDDFIFPHIGVNGIIRTDRQMSYDTLQAILSDFCEQSGTQKKIYHPLFPARWCPVSFHVCSDWPTVVLKSDSMVGWLGSW